MEWRHRRRPSMQVAGPERRRYGVERFEPVIPMESPVFNFDAGHQYAEVDVMRPAWQRLAPRRIFIPAEARTVNIHPAIDIRAYRRRGNERTRLQLMHLMGNGD